MQVCSKVGKIAKLDYLFHKSGPLRGKPRGYAFVEYATVAVSSPPVRVPEQAKQMPTRDRVVLDPQQEAQRAVTELDQKLVRGRKMSVTTAAEQARRVPPPNPASGT